MPSVTSRSISASASSRSSFRSWSILLALSVWPSAITEHSFPSAPPVSEASE